MYYQISSAVYWNLSFVALNCRKFWVSKHSLWSSGQRRKLPFAKTRVRARLSHQKFSKRMIDAPQQNSTFQRRHNLIIMKGTDNGIMAQSKTDGSNRLIINPDELNTLIVNMMQQIWWLAWCLSRTRDNLQMFIEIYLLNNSNNCPQIFKYVIEETILDNSSI